MMIRFTLLFLICLIGSQIEASPSLQEKVLSAFNDPNQLTFTPPEGWQFMDPAKLPPQVKVMAVGKGKEDFPPSINLGFDTCSDSLKNYLKSVKKINKADGVHTKDLGMVKTAAGSAALLQIDGKTQWGDERQLQALFLHDGKVWILTCSALKKEFSSYYKTFFDAIKSLSINPPLEKNQGM